MKPFHTIAIPHRDILEGRLTMDVFAADLYEVSQGRGPDEYRDADIFFRKTYLTEGLKNLLNIVEKRLNGKGGDPVIQIQTPFGGGKTHALIAMYHKAKDWEAKPVVISGTALSTEETLWGVMERQLTDKVEKLRGNVSPGKEAIRRLLEDKQPVLILMDEVLEYVTKAGGVKVGESTLAAQTIAFMQELTEAAGIIGKVCLVMTLPSSIIEHYDESAERLFLQLQKVAGRVEKIYTPVEEKEISKVIRRRLFSSINDNEAKKVIEGFIEYAEREGILPAGIEPSEYRNRFMDSYPFMPEVIDVLYHRWGSFPNFQRTRGVLRILSLVINSLKNKEVPYISLSDFDLSNHEIRQEFLKHIGTEFNSVIAQDITDADAGAKKIDLSLGSAYLGLKISTRAVTTIFLYSFSGGTARGATLSEVKRSATTLQNPSSVVAEAIEQLKGRLFYLQSSGDKYFFSNQPNINRIILTKIENIKDYEVEAFERELLKRNIKGDKFKVFIWEENHANIIDSEEIKLIILRKEDRRVMEEIIQNKGGSPRINRNIIFFLYPMESERQGFLNIVKKRLAYDSVEQDKSLSLTDEQRKEIRKEIKNIEDGLKDSLRRFYRIVAVPDRTGFKTEDLGIPTFGEDNALDHEVYEILRAEGEILEKVAPLVIKEKYLSNRDYLHTVQLYQSTLRTPGEVRFINRSVLEEGIREGVLKGLFGLGELEGDKPLCKYFKEHPSLAFLDNEILIKEGLCHKEVIVREPTTVDSGTGVAETVGSIATTLSPSHSTTFEGRRENLQFRFIVPRGKVSNIMGVLNYLQTKFNTLEIELIATDGSISETEIEDRIKEAFRQLGIEIVIE
ncbi:DUF499 domain-containing protein [hot springs metagenome]|uniref:DUF499 domain-containing protein n=1 Tax=hot springs metagenome TaxID=433727 RepID=A0A5J4L8C8_9ZZZZ